MMITTANPGHVDTIVIGAGQAGLSTGYHLAQRKVRFLILDANPRVGDAWRNRWDSLRLFTRARFAGLDGMPFPANPQSFPGKDMMADYLEAYASRFNLPVRNGVRVQHLSREDGHFLLDCGSDRFTANHVIIAMSDYQRPKIPAFADDLAPTIHQLHSSQYRDPSQLVPGPVLVVGAGNSGAEIALDAVHGHHTWLAGAESGHVPFNIDSVIGRNVLMPLLLRVVFHRVLTMNTPMGRKMRPKFTRNGGPLVRVKPKQLTVAGIERVPRVQDARNGLPLLADGRQLDPATVVWCTGFHPGFDWVDLPIHKDGELDQDRGVSHSVPGLFFVGQEFQYAASSTMIHGVGRDARFVARQVAARTANQAESRTAVSSR